MPTATRTFRVFVSSTFEDLKAERDALQRHVFPRLRRLCEANNARFQAIDLRWGVRDEAALDQQTLEICLREIERCQQTGIKPNFIVLLGERYGWRPLPARIEAGEFEQIFSAVSQEEKKLLLCEKNQPAAGRGWYLRDDNAAPAEYILRPRELSVAADEPEEEKQAAREQEARAWKATEDALREIFRSAIARLGWRVSFAVQYFRLNFGVYFRGLFDRTFPNRLAWQSGAVPPQFSPGHVCDSWCQFGVNPRRLRRFCRLCYLVSHFFQLFRRLTIPWHGRCHQFRSRSGHQLQINGTEVIQDAKAPIASDFPYRGSDKSRTK